MSDTSLEWIGGLKYLTIEIRKPAGQRLLMPSVEVSPNLIDWYSGENHTTIMIDNTSMLKVHDNTPLKAGRKRYIRLK